MKKADFQVCLNRALQLVVEQGVDMPHFFMPPWKKEQPDIFHLAVLNVN